MSKLGREIEEVMAGMEETKEEKKKRELAAKAKQKPIPESEPEIGSKIIPPEDDTAIVKAREVAFNKMTDSEKYKYTYGSDKEKEEIKQKYGIK